MCKVLLKQQNGSDDFYLVILKKEIAFLTVITPDFITWDQSVIRCCVHPRGESIYRTNTIASLRIL